MKKAAFLFFRVEVGNAACAVQYLVVVQTMLVRCPKNLDFTVFQKYRYLTSSFNRPDFKKMMELVKAESSCCVIVKDLSRLGRDTIDTQQYIEKIFPFLLVRFIAINDYYDSSAPLASRKDTEAKFKNLVNGIYPQICSKNIKQVMRKQAEAGKYHGSVPPYGYMFKNEDKTVLHLDREVSEMYVLSLIKD